MSLARQLLLLQVFIVGLLVAGGSVLVYLDVARQTETTATDEVVSVASTIAASPTVIAALGAADPSATLQPYAERVRLDTDVDFVTIMSPAGVRYTHPNPAMIGGPFLGHTERALAGERFTETYTGTLGPSIRAVVPVFGPRVSGGSGPVVGLVSVGITLEALAGQVSERVVALVVVALAALGVGLVGTYLVSRRIRRQTHDLGPAELGRRIEYHEAILHAVREGLLLVDRDNRVTLCNDGARHLLDLDGPPATIEQLGLPGPLAASLAAGRVVHDELHLTDRRVLLVNSAQVRPSGAQSGEHAHGTVVTLRDHTELQSLTGELDSVRGFAESLRSQAHEAANRLHTVVSLVELGRGTEAVEFATAELRVAQELTDRVVGAVAEPVLAALLLGKAAQAHERGVSLVIGEDTEIDDVGVPPGDLVTILGNLIDNAVDAALGTDGPVGRNGHRPTVSLTARTEDGTLLLRVADTGPGLDGELAAAAFERGWSTKGDGGPAGRGLGLALVGQAVRRNHGTIEVGAAPAEAGAAGGGAVFTVRLPLS